MKTLTPVDLKLIRTYVTKWDLVRDIPLRTPGPEGLYVHEAEGSRRHEADFLDAERVVSKAIIEQQKDEKVNPEWMTRLLVHVYRNGYPASTFRVYDDPAKGYVPLGLVELGFDAETLCKVRLYKFQVRLLAKIDESLKIAS